MIESEMIQFEELKPIYVNTYIIFCNAICETFAKSFKYNFKKYFTYFTLEEA